MKLFIVLAALAIEFALTRSAVFRHIPWVGVYKPFELISRRFPAQPTLGAWLCLLVSTAGIVLIAIWLLTLSRPVSACCYFVVLFLCLGPRNINREIETYLQNYTAVGDTPASLNGCTFLHDMVVGDENRDTAVLGAMVVATNDRIFTPICWFLLIGPAGCLIYRYCAELSRSASVTDRHRQLFRSAYQCGIWLPARLLALGMAFAGSLPPAWSHWRQYDDGSLAITEPLLARLGVLALSPGQLRHVVQHELHVYWVNRLYVILKISLLIWLVLYFVVTLGVR